MKNIRPAHYRSSKNGLDLFYFFEAFMPEEWVIGFYVLNIIKYVVRFPKKNGKEDLIKARTYLDRLIKREGADDETDATSTKN